MTMNYIFYDTMIYLHYKMFTELDFSEIIGDAPITGSSVHTGSTFRFPALHFPGPVFLSLVRVWSLFSGRYHLFEIGSS